VKTSRLPKIVAHIRSILPMIKLTLAPIIWGGALVAGRVVSAELPPFMTSCIRFFVASIFTLPFLYKKEGHFPKLSRKDFLWLLLMSLVGMVAFNVLLFTSLKTITAVRSSVMLAFTPAVVMLAAFVLYKEKISAILGLGIALAGTGAIITITNGDLSGVLATGLAVGDIYMLGAVLAWAAYSIIIKHAMSNLSPMALLAYGSAIGVIILLPFTFLEHGWSALAQLSPAAMGCLLYLSVGAAGIAYLWYYEGIAIVGSTKATVFLNLEPLAAITLGVLLLSEEFTPIIAFGTALVIGGLLLTNYRPKMARNQVQG